MSVDLSLRVDDLSPEEVSTVASAYETALDTGDHEAAFEQALTVLCSLRPTLPPNVAAVELELLLDGLPPAAALAPAGQPVFQAL